MLCRTKQTEAAGLVFSVSVPYPNLRKPENIINKRSRVLSHPQTERHVMFLLSEELKRDFFKPAECVFWRVSVSQLVETFLNCVCVCERERERFTHTDKADVFLSWHPAGQHRVCLCLKTQTEPRVLV